MIYITSDFHFGHDKSFIWESRGFSSVEEMNETLISNFNSIVKPEDHIYILGDLMLGDLKEGLALIEKLNGKLHIVRGNHCTNVRWAAYVNLPNVIEMQNALYLSYKKYNFYLSHYPTVTSNYDYNKPLRKRLLNLCGHTHTTDKWADADLGFIYHCEVDAHNCYPVLLDNIIEDFKLKLQ